jgi:hypothetical protein
VPTLAWQIWRFAKFLSISLPLSRNLTPSLYHTIFYVNESRRWQTFSLFALSELVYSLFALSELVCTKNVFYPILLFPLLSHPKLLPLWSVTDGRTNFNTPRYQSSFFFHWARGALSTRRRNSTGLGEGRKPGVFMNPRVTHKYSFLAWRERIESTHKKNTTLEPNYNQLFLNVGRGFSWMSIVSIPTVENKTKVFQRERYQRVFNESRSFTWIT